MAADRIALQHTAQVLDAASKYAFHSKRAALALADVRLAAGAPAYGHGAAGLPQLLQVPDADLLYRAETEIDLAQVRACRSASTRVYCCTKSGCPCIAWQHGALTAGTCRRHRLPSCLPTCPPAGSASSTAAGGTAGGGRHPTLAGSGGCAASDG